jgi:hypothetical protein
MLCVLGIRRNRNCLWWRESVPSACIGPGDCHSGLSGASSAMVPFSALSSPDTQLTAVDVTRDLVGCRTDIGHYSHTLLGHSCGQRNGPDAHTQAKPPGNLVPGSRDSEIPETILVVERTGFRIICPSAGHRVVFWSTSRFCVVAASVSPPSCHAAHIQHRN